MEDNKKRQKNLKISVLPDLPEKCKLIEVKLHEW
jgi:hypothetical protein